MIRVGIGLGGWEIHHYPYISVNNNNNSLFNLQIIYVVTGMTKMCVAFKIANGGFYLFTLSFILQRLDANILHFCIFQMRHLQVYAFPTMKQMYSLEIPVCSFLAKCPSTQVFSDAFIFLILSILNLFTQLFIYLSLFFK